MRFLVFSALLCGCGGSLGTGNLAAPIADGGFDRVVPINETTTLDAIRSCDPDGGSLSYTWTLISKPSGSSTLISGGGVQLLVTPDMAGDYLVELKVKNGERESHPVYVMVTATATESAWTTGGGPGTADRCGNAF